MKMIAKALVALALILTGTPVIAQTLTNHAVAVGRGAGVQGFAAVGPGSANTVLLGQGGSANPSFGQVPNAALVNPATIVNGQTCTLGSTCIVSAPATSITVGTTTVGSGTATRVLYDNSGVLGEYAITGTGNVVLSTSPAFTGAPTLGGSGSGTTAVQASAVASGTLTLPAATDTLLGKATTDTLTNKTYDTAGTGNVLKVNGQQVTTLSVTSSPIIITGTNNVRSGGVAGLDNQGAWFVYRDITTAGTGFGGALRGQNTYTYTGGTPGNVNSTTTTITDVSANVADYIWVNLVKLNNNATAGENVAAYLAGNKNSTGTTWASVLDAADTTGTANPASGLYGAEVDLDANGTDTSNTRRGVDIIGGRYNASGADAELGNGLIVETAISDAGHATFNRGIWFNGAFKIGFDLTSGTYSDKAIALAAAQRIYLDNAGGRSIRVETGTFYYNTPSGNVFAVNTDGFPQIGAATGAPAGGGTGKFINLGSSSTFGVYYGSGVPTVSAAQGSLYLRTDGSTTITRAYINTNGSTTWTAITTVS